jgi:hypothetical protein
MNLEKYSFFCPECKNQLDVDGVIHLKTERENGDIGEIYLSTKFGDYNFKHFPKTKFDKDELVEFSCPNCSSMLHSTLKPKFVNMVMRVEKQFDFEILFSRQAGCYKTYIVTEDGIESYGVDATKTDF